MTEAKKESIAAKDSADKDTFSVGAKLIDDIMEQGGDLGVVLESLVALNDLNTREQVIIRLRKLTIQRIITKTAENPDLSENTLFITLFASLVNSKLLLSDESFKDKVIDIIMTALLTTIGLLTTYPNSAKIKDMTIYVFNFLLTLAPEKAPGIAAQADFLQPLLLTLTVKKERKESKESPALLIADDPSEEEREKLNALLAQFNSLPEADDNNQGYRNLFYRFYRENIFRERLMLFAIQAIVNEKGQRVFDLVADESFLALAVRGSHERISDEQGDHGKVLEYLARLGRIQSPGYSLALYTALVEGKKGSIKCLLDPKNGFAIDVNALNSCGISVFHQAIQCLGGDADTAIQLFESTTSNAQYCPQSNSVVTASVFKNPTDHYDGQTVYHFGCSSGNPKVIKRVLQLYGFSDFLGPKDHKGRTPIGLLFETKNESLLRELLTVSPIIPKELLKQLKQQDVNGLSMCDYAKIYPHPQMQRLVEDALKASTTPTNKNEGKRRFTKEDISSAPAQPMQAPRGNSGKFGSLSNSSLPAPAAPSSASAAPPTPLAIVITPPPAPASS